MSDSVTELVLGCRSWQQAQDIIDHLFSKQLIAHAEILPLQKNIDEIRVIINNFELNILDITRELTRRLGHTNFNLVALPR